MNIEVTRYRTTRYWSVMVNGELLAVTVYRKGARAVADALANPLPRDQGAIVEDGPKPGTNPENTATNTATYPVA